MITTRNNTKYLTIILSASVLSFFAFSGNSFREETNTKTINGLFGVKPPSRATSDKIKSKTRKKFKVVEDIAGQSIRTLSKLDPDVYYSPPKTVITPLNNTFLISNKEFCKIVSPELIIFIPSSPHNVDRRSAIRKTYGTLSRDKKSRIHGAEVEFIIRIIFIIGKSPSAPVSNSIYIESEKHGDIVLVDLNDTYRELTKKVLYGLKWVNEFCSSALYVMKTDDDVFVNLGILSQRLRKNKPRKKGTVYGYMQQGLRTVERTGKWALSYEEFPLERFPEYMSGTSYTVTMNLVPKILYSAQRLPFMSVEDAFISGVIANKIHGAEMVHWRDNSRWDHLLPNLCNFVKGQLSMTNITPKLMYKSWQVLISNGRCV